MIRGMVDKLIPALLAAVPFLAASRDLAAQHCANTGIHDPQSPGDKYGLVRLQQRMAGWDEVRRWNETAWEWRENGVGKREFVLPVGRGTFFEAWIFVSPAGNGFAVVGKPMPREAATPSMISYFSPDGRLISAFPMEDILSEKERVLKSGCGGEKENDGSGCYRYYSLAENPKYSVDGTCVEFSAPATRRLVRFSLTLGMPVNELLDRQLLRLLRWTPEEGKQEEQAIRNLIEDLDDERIEVREGATDSLRGRGLLAIGALEKAAAAAPSAEVRSRIELILRSLRPWRGFSREWLLRDLDILSRLLSHSDAAVALSARARLSRILPASKDLDPAGCLQWIDAHRSRLRWDESRGIYGED